MSAYKGGLSATGPSFTEKAKLQMRRPTPDSDVLASSDDDHDHTPMTAKQPMSLFPGGRRPSSGWLQDIQPSRKFSLPSGSLTGSQPTTPSLEPPQNNSRPSTSSFPWNTNPFGSPSNNRLKEVVPSPTSAVAPGDRALPSPTNFEADEAFGHLLNQSNSVRKPGRSQSYSVGQQDLENSQLPSRMRGSAGPVRHRPSKPSLLGSDSLSQLREDDIDEVESSNGSEQGVRLPTGYWEPKQNPGLLKQAAYENARRHRTMSTSSPVSHQRRKVAQGIRSMTQADITDYAVDELDDADYGVEHTRMSLPRRFSEHVGSVGRESDIDQFSDSSKKTQWSTLPTMLSQDNLGRRHSFATYSTHNQQALHHQPRLSNTYEEDEDVAPDQQSQSPGPEQPFDTTAYFTGYGPASRAINASAISAAHPDPILPHTSSISVAPSNPYQVPSVLGRPGRRLFVVSFKCSRAEIYYLYDNTGLEIRCGDLVIVEGDRGCDLGQVTHADVSLEDAKKFKAEANEEHFRWLVMFSQYSLSGSSTENGMLGSLARANGFPNVNRASLTGMGAQQETDSKPKMIKRLAQQHEIMGLRDKEGQEAKAKRVGAQKAAEHKLPMEVLDAEYQADYHKLTYYYYAEAYVNFNDLVTDLFKQYKVRIWMSAVNPASVVNPAGIMQVSPPTAIGPGAILHSHSANTSLPVGPGFGSSGFRQNEQYARTGHATGQSYDDAYYAFSHQLPGFPNQQPYGVPSWGPSQQSHDMYGRYGGFPMAAGFPNPSAGGSPMNFGAYYPPSTYSSSPAFNNASSGPSYRSGHTATSLSAGNQGTHPSGPAPYNNGYDPAHLANVMQNMNLNK